jgi:hypothetical protein
MRIWHGIVAVLVVALLMPMVRLGSGPLLLVYILLLLAWYGAGRALWGQPRTIRGGREKYQEPLGCLSMCLLVVYSLLTLLLFFMTLLVVPLAFRALYLVLFHPGNLTE